MTKEQKKLWEKIKDFEIDDPESSLSFSDRLARDNDWPIEFALRAINEYKKFIFLIVSSKDPKTPSDEVDQVWHFHLLYTRSYWVDFCKHTLGQEIHHGPTKGIEQQDDFRVYYQETLKQYEIYFNVKPPIDIWPNVQKRFEISNFQRIDKSKHWIIKKPFN